MHFSLSSLQYTFHNLAVLNLVDYQLDRFVLTFCLYTTWVLLNVCIQSKSCFGIVVMIHI